MSESYQDHQAIDLFENTAEQEEKAFQLFLRVWSRAHPRPDVGLFSKLGVISVSALVILVASATAIPFAAATSMEMTKFFPDVPGLGILAFLLVGLVVGINEE